MVKHIVMFKLCDATEESVSATKEILLSMRENVPTAKSVEVYIDELHTVRSFDIMLEVVVDSFKTLEEYQIDEYHVSVVKKHMHAASERSVAFDFTVN